MERIPLNRLDVAAQFLKEGRLVAFPTETVYGLGAMLFDPNAVRSLFIAKGRPADNPLIVHISSITQVEELAVEIPSLFYRLAKEVFPGPLTLVLRKHPRVPREATGGGETVAIRMPNHPVAHTLIDLVGQPLVAPSANLSGRPSATMADHVICDFEGKIAGVVMGGRTELGIESTVLSLVHAQPLLLRPGGCSRERIEQILGEKIEIAGEHMQGKPLSPGMKYRHYAPKTPIRLFHSEASLCSYLQQKQLLRCMVLSESFSLPLPKGADLFPLRASSLYMLYRLSEERKDEEILICIEDVDRIDSALKNRILHSYTM